MSAGVCVNCEYIENYPQSIKDGKLPRDTNLQSCKCVCYNAERCVIHLSPKNTAQCAICRNCWTLRVRRNNVRARKVKNTGAYRKCALKAPNSKYIFSASFSLSLSVCFEISQTGRLSRHQLMFLGIFSSQWHPRRPINRKKTRKSGLLWKHVFLRAAKTSVLKKSNQIKGRRLWRQWWCSLSPETLPLLFFQHGVQLVCQIGEHVADVVQNVRRLLTLIRSETHKLFHFITLDKLVYKNYWKLSTNLFI